MALDEKGKATLANAMKQKVFKESFNRIIVSLLWKEPEGQLKPFEPDADVHMQNAQEAEAGAQRDEEDELPEDGDEMAEDGDEMAEEEADEMAAENA